MKKALLLLFALTGCAHAIKNLSDCDQVTGDQRVACGACLLQNKAEGWLGLFEYRPDNSEGQRCVRVK
jgi:hypothetical protein